MNGDGTILSVQSVSKRFGGLQAVNQASLTVARGSITALIGPNGAGKTTLFNLITGFIRPDAGVVTFAGQPITRRPPYAIARRGLVRTFQIPKALTKMTVRDNMLLAAPDQPGETFWGGLLGRWTQREAEITARATTLLELFRLDALAEAYAGTLSGGQRKLLELARALMARPTLVLLDEPMAGVNPTLGRELLAHMELLRAEEGMTFLYIEHDMDIVMTHSDRVIVMADGSVIADGSPERIRQDPAVIDAYLGAHAPDTNPNP